MNASLPVRQEIAVPASIVRGDSASGSMLEVCSVRVGPTVFGIPIEHIVEIIGGVRPRPVPLAPDFVGGLIHYRGDILTTVSLRRLLYVDGIQCTDGRQDIVVLEGPGGCFGLQVDSVGQVLTVSSADHEPNPSILDGHRRALFAGAYKLTDGLLIMLDSARLDPDLLSPALIRSERVDSGPAIGLLKS